MGKVKADSKAEAASRAASLLSEVEDCFEETERLTVGYSRLREVERQDGWTAMHELWLKLGKEGKSAIQRAGGLIAPAWSCFRAIDFWYPSQGKTFLAAFNEDVAPLYPEEVDGLESIHPFLRELHALLLRTASVIAAGEPARTIDRAAEPEPDAPAPRSRFTGTAAAGASQMLDERQAAAVLKLSVQLLRKWRAQWAKGERQGPEFIYLGKCVRYSVSGIERFLEVRCSAQGKAPAMVQ